MEHHFFCFPYFWDLEAKKEFKSLTNEANRLRDEISKCKYPRRVAKVHSTSRSERPAAEAPSEYRLTCDLCEADRVQCIGEMCKLRFFPKGPNARKHYGYCKRMYGGKTNFLERFRYVQWVDLEVAFESLVKEVVYRIEDPVRGCYGRLEDERRKVCRQRKENDLLREKLRRERLLCIQKEQVTVFRDPPEVLPGLRWEPKKKMGSTPPRGGFPSSHPNQQLIESDSDDNGLISKAPKKSRGRWRNRQKSNCRSRAMEKSDENAPGGTPIMLPSLPKEKVLRHRPGPDGRLKDERVNRDRDGRANGSERFDRSGNSQSHFRSKNGGSSGDNRDESDNFGGQGIPVSSSPSDVDPPPVLMPVPGAGPLGPFIRPPPEVTMHMLREQGGPSPFEGGRNGWSGATTNVPAPIIAFPPVLKQEPSFKKLPRS